MMRYLDVLEPLLGASSSKMSVARGHVRAFSAPHGPGVRAQAALERRREEVENWVSWCNIFQEFLIFMKKCYFPVLEPLSPINQRPLC